MHRTIKPIEMKKILTVGQKVMWRGSWGKDAPIGATVTAIAHYPSEKPIKTFWWDKIEGRNIVVSLSNGHWAYGCDIDQYNP